jgi:hypothetical protein
VVRANLAAKAALRERCSGNFYNVSGGTRSSLLELLKEWEELIGSRLESRFASPRCGNARDGGADVTAAV